MAATMCGTMPTVQPMAATRLARRPRPSPAAMVNRAPVPGVTTTTRVVSRKVSDTAAGYSGWVAEEDTRVVASRLRPEPTTIPVPPGGAPRQQSLYDLQPGDPDRLGPFRCIHRLKPGIEPVNADKPTPVLGTAADASADEGPPTFVVIK